MDQNGTGFFGFTSNRTDLRSFDITSHQNCIIRDSTCQWNANQICTLTQTLNHLTQFISILWKSLDFCVFWTLGKVASGRSADCSKTLMMWSKTLCSWISSFEQQDLLTEPSEPLSSNKKHFHCSKVNRKTHAKNLFFLRFNNWNDCLPLDRTQQNDKHRSNDLGGNTTWIWVGCEYFYTILWMYSMGIYVYVHM